MTVGPYHLSMESLNFSSVTYIYEIGAIPTINYREDFKSTSLNLSVSPHAYANTWLEEEQNNEHDVGKGIAWNASKLSPW